VSGFLCVGAFSGTIQQTGAPDLSRIASGPVRCETDIRMPGTGPLRRSSATDRIKAIVDKSRVEREEPSVCLSGVWSLAWLFRRPPSGLAAQSFAALEAIPCFR
jgi:hypothetical protein